MTDFLFLIKLQLACFAICVFISRIYFSSKRVNTKLHSGFAIILNALPVYLLFDIASVYTVNTDNVPFAVRNCVHRLFLWSLTFTTFLFCIHMSRLIEKEEGESMHKWVTKVISVTTLVLSLLYTLFAKPSYIAHSISNYASASFAIGAFAAAGIYVVTIGILLIVHWNILPKKMKLAVGVSLIIESIGLYFQIFHTYFLTSGFVLTMMMLAFYVTLENPDALLLARVEEEKRKADEANASKSAFISVVSHEIRTPMNAIMGMTEVMLRNAGNLNDKQKEYLVNIKNSSAALVMIVNDILDQSKIEAGKMEIVEDDYDLRLVAGDVRMIIENMISAKPIELVYDIDDDIPDSIVGDGLRIRQILINLMNNAVKYTSRGSIVLSIHVTQSEENRMLLRFSVKDTGQGIREEDLKKLGEAFTQVDIKLNHSKEGTGLGLSISKDFVSLMGGQLEVESEYGVGTEFFFSIWQKVSESQKQSENFTAGGARVMIVDDTEINLMLTKELLEPFGMTVDLADSGKKAIELLGEHHYDMIFMDYIMPQMDGAQTTGMIRSMADEAASRGENERGEYLRNLPIVALTGDTSCETREKFRQAGINDFIEKPVGYQRLRRQLRRWLPEELKENIPSKG